MRHAVISSHCNCSTATWSPSCQSCTSTLPAWSTTRVSGGCH